MRRARPPAPHLRPRGPAARRRVPDARSLRFAPGLTIGAGVLPREELAAGHLFPALGRVRELDLFDFGVFGEEAFNGRRLHAWARRISPTCRRGKKPGYGVRGKRDGGERGTKSKGPVRRKSGGHTRLADPLGHPAQGASAFCAPGLASSSRSGE